MEKLIELLNEMIKSKGNCYKIIDYAGGIFIIDDKANKYRCNLYPAVVISKEYGFIKWLVDNDKIALYGEKNIGYIKLECRCDGQYETIEEVDKYEKALMLLSIQDNPIDFLVSILR